MHFHTYLWIFRNVCVWIFLILLLHIMCINYSFLPCVFVFYCNMSWKPCQYAWTLHILITKACFYIVWLYYVISLPLYSFMELDVEKIIFLSSWYIIITGLCRTLSCWIWLIYLPSWFLDDTGLVLLELSCHGIGNDLSRTFRSKNNAHINQCPVSFLSIFGTQHSALTCHFPTYGQNYLLIPQVFLRVST